MFVLIYTNPNTDSMLFGPYETYKEAVAEMRSQYETNLSYYEPEGLKPEFDAERGFAEIGQGGDDANMPFYSEECWQVLQPTKDGVGF